MFGGGVELQFPFRPLQAMNGAACVFENRQAVKSSKVLYLPIISMLQFF
jgi:hypothetical protein